MYKLIRNILCCIGIHGFYPHERYPHRLYTDHGSLRAMGQMCPRCHTWKFKNLSRIERGITVTFEPPVLNAILCRLGVHDYRSLVDSFKLYAEDGMPIARMRSCAKCDKTKIRKL